MGRSEVSQTNSLWDKEAQVQMTTLEKGLRNLSLTPIRTQSEEELVQNFRDNWNSGNLVVFNTMLFF